MRPLVSALWVFTLFAGLALPIQAQVYKCRLANGQTEISSQPCQGGKTLEVRPEERVNEANRLAAEQDLERARKFIDQREAAQRADNAEALERERLQAAGVRRGATSNQGQNYSNADECLRDVAQMALETTQRSQMEADCRRITRNQPQTVYVPYPVAVPVQRPVYVHPSPSTPMQSAPTIAIQPRKK